MAFLERERQAFRAGPAPLFRWVGRIQRLDAGPLIAWVYAGLVAEWWVLHQVSGDRIWWIALVSVFAPYLFAPLLLLAPLGLVKPSARYWAALLLVVAILLAEYGAPLAVRAAAGTETGDEITLLTFNVWGYSSSPETVRAIVSQGTPDVVVLQELSPGLVPTLVEELGELYPYRLLNPDEAYQGGGVLSRYPVRAARLPAGSPVGRFAQVVEIEAGERVFTLYNVHLHSTSALHYIDSGRAVAEKVRTSFAVRERQVDQLLKDMDRRTGPVLIAGDFNMTSQSDAYRALAGRVQDAHREAGRGFGHTFPAYGGHYRGIPILARMVRIDMILYSSEWTAVECRVLREHGQSDHLPVLARLAWSSCAQSCKIL